jgi:hypothetical protein
VRTEHIPQPHGVSWRGEQSEPGRCLLMHERHTTMHHSGCTPRQPTPFEIRTMRPTISRSPRRPRGESVRWLAHTTGHVNVPGY